jgi:AraC family transcriptional regulator
VEPRIISSAERKLVGTRMRMSLATNKTGELWRSFVPRRSEITNNVTRNLISMQIYGPAHFTAFKPTNEFEKWATVEVADFQNVPGDMEAFTLQEGLYAVFDYTGSSNDASIFEYIFGTWLPGSEYDLDDRPHFEILGDKYSNNDPTSKEEIWIPIKPKP